MEWINVKDRLPNFGETVLTYEYEIVANGLERFVKIRKFSKHKFAQHNFIVTHWMELPDPPNI